MPRGMADRMTRPCHSCGARYGCIWADTAWTCRQCGDEWDEDHDPIYAAPGDYVPPKESSPQPLRCSYTDLKLETHTTTTHEGKHEMPNSTKIPAKSLEFFLALAKDAGNWSGAPWLNGNVSGGHGASSMSQTLVRKGLIVVEQGEDGSGQPAPFAQFTQKGIDLAAQHGVDLSFVEPVPAGTPSAEVTNEAPVAAAEAPAEKKSTKKASKAAAKDAPAKREPKTFDAASVETFKCEGPCGETLPVKKFPTVTGTTRRGVVCRKCRDAHLAK